MNPYDLEVVADFLESNHGAFQRYLEENLSLDPSEADLIIEGLKTGQQEGAE